MPPKDVPGLFVPLVQMAICLHPDNSAALVNEALLAAANALERLGPARLDHRITLTKSLRHFYLEEGYFVSQVVLLEERN
ncbi:unnamed protein product [Dibothriocephalus latus]|uniref:Uncharacterized protein n=1 Tax=Dibothriocephalus latus TaxID=60516 RepID=A0A3P7NML7_DIBLA|nr:unnamed protein product [Dibothriocephalus latus]